MSQWISFVSSGGGSIANLDTTYEMIGFDTGAGSTVTTGAGTNTKGTYVQLSAATANNWSGFYVTYSSAGAASQRFLADVSFDGGTTANVPNLYLEPGSPLYGLSGPIYIPMLVSAGSDVRVRVQCGSTGGNLRVAIIGVVRTSQSRPCFTTCVNINAADTAGTRAGSIDIPLTNAWTEVAASTANTYGAIMTVFGSSTVMATAQAVGLAMGTGAAASEVERMRVLGGTGTSSPNLRGGSFPLLESSISSGTRLSARGFAATPGSDVLRVQMLGFS